MNDGVGGYRPVSRADGYNARDDLARRIREELLAPGLTDTSEEWGVDAIDGENNVQVG